MALSPRNKVFVLSKNQIPMERPAYGRECVVEVTELTVLVIMIVAGWAIYSLVAANTKRGAETVRAHVFLGGLMAGASVSEANGVAAYDVASGPTDVIQSAMLHLKAEYGGKQARMISDAYSKGMTPRLPAWYRSFVLKV